MHSGVLVILRPEFSVRSGRLWYRIIDFMRAICTDIPRCHTNSVAVPNPTSIRILLINVGKANEASLIVSLIVTPNVIANFFY